MAGFDDGRAGPAAGVRRGGRLRRVLGCFGPERLCGEWWRGDQDTRDYYRLHTDDGAWLWVFRSAESGRWFRHGEWA
ncbi:MAG: hypothetical protein IBJ11_12085 [Phycisphaerales bacterium]|nr:hypothetical protein [Phycisphaerales bacterium]